MNKNKPLTLQAIETFLILKYKSIKIASELWMNGKLGFTDQEEFVIKNYIKADPALTKIHSFYSKR
jgi:hypothetical protein